MRALLCLTLLTGCAALDFTREDTRWFTESQPGQYLYQDEDFEIQLVNTGDEFRWRIKNTSLVPLEIDARELGLYIEGDTTPYTFWGEPRKDDRILPQLSIQPNDYIQLNYPVRYRSPFRPWSTRPIVLIFTGKWRFETIQYAIRFPVVQTQETEQ